MLISKWLTVANGLNTVALCGKEIRAILIDSWIQKDKVTQCNPELDDDHITIVSCLDLIILSTILVRSFDNITRSGRCCGRDCWSSNRHSGSDIRCAGGAHTDLRPIHLVDIVAGCVDNLVTQFSIRIPYGQVSETYSIPRFQLGSSDFLGSSD